MNECECILCILWAGLELTRICLSVSWVPKLKVCILLSSIMPNLFFSKLKNEISIAGCECDSPQFYKVIILNQCLLNVCYPVTNKSQPSE